MNDDVDLSSDFNFASSGVGTPRRSSDLLSGLAQVRRIAEQSDQQRHLSSARNSDLRNRLEELRKIAARNNAENNPQLPKVHDKQLRDEVESIHRELGVLRTQTTDVLDNIQEPSDPTDEQLSKDRELELEAKLQAERQQAAQMRKLLEERERALRELEDQCQTLQDDLEDRDREMDHLNRKIEQVQTDQPTFKPEINAVGTEHLSPRTNSNPNPNPNAMPSADHALDFSELFNAEDFEYKQKTAIVIPWQAIGKTAGAVLAIGIIITLGILLRSHRSQPKPNVLVETPHQPQPQLPPQLQPRPATVQTSPTPINNTKNVSSYRIPLPIQDRLHSGGVGPKMIKLPAGTFSMGKKNAYAFSEREEVPLHDVTVKAFYMASYETTFAEYDRFARISGRSLPSDYGFGRGDRPVIDVSWEDAQAYARWLSTETGQHYYLPSEAQWEYAARGGTDTTYWWGDDKEDGRAVCFHCNTRWNSSGTAPVGSLLPNPFKLYDTAGNVMEWVQDCYNIGYNGAPDDGRPWMTGDCSQHIVRGGAFSKPIVSARNSWRFKLPTEGQFDMLGFRVARD